MGLKLVCGKDGGGGRLGQRLLLTPQGKMMSVPEKEAVGGSPAEKGQDAIAGKWRTSSSLPS